LKELTDLQELKELAGISAPKGCWIELSRIVDETAKLERELEALNLLAGSLACKGDSGKGKSHVGDAVAGTKRSKPSQKQRKAAAKRTVGGENGARCTLVLRLPRSVAVVAVLCLSSRGDRV